LKVQPTTVRRRPKETSHQHLARGSLRVRYSVGSDFPHLTKIIHKSKIDSRQMSAKAGRQQPFRPLRTNAFVNCVLSASVHRQTQARRDASQLANGRNRESAKPLFLPKVRAEIYHLKLMIGNMRLR
jgi:hypothetical protein